MNQPQPIYIPQMSSIVERVNNPPRLVQAIQAHNEEEFIGLTLASIYDEVDRIIVIEGAVKNRPNSTEDGHSTDRTIEIIEDFIENKDTAKKVTFIKTKKPWDNLEHMKQTFLSMCFPGDWIIINDADEFYRPEDIKRLRRLIDLEPHVTEFIPLFLHFYRDFGHVATPAPEWQPQHQRIFKYFHRNMRYNSHPVVTDPGGNCTYFSPYYQPRRIPLHDFYVFHYGYARNSMDSVMDQKREYYKKELAGHGGADKPFDEKVRIWLDKAEQKQEFLTVPRTLHPEVVQSHPMWGYEDEHMASLACSPYDEHPLYKKDLAGEPYGNIWLCMTQQSQPHMPFYHNSMTVEL